jgi:hypothetical protein
VYLLHYVPPSKWDRREATEPTPARTRLTTGAWLMNRLTQQADDTEPDAPRDTARDMRHGAKETAVELRAPAPIRPARAPPLGDSR